VATPPGRGAIAIVRLSGPDVRPIAARVLRTARPLRARVATLATVVDARGEPIDRGVALLFPGPASYTGEDVLELHVHGSPAVARETLIATLAAGARPAQPGEFTRRAYLAGKLDLTAAEAVADLIDADRAAAARAALGRLSGGLAAEVDALRARLERVAEELAAAVDFPDEVAPPDPSRLAAEIGAVRERCAALARDWERGRVVREGLSVAIVGPPNAGKSSLLNALLGTDRAIVSGLPGTTRDTLEETLALGSGWARLIDTAGIRAHAGQLEAEGIARSEAALAAAEVALVVVDGAQPLGPEARDILARTRGRPRLLFFNKADVGRAGYDQRDAGEAEALLGSTRLPGDVEAVRAALARLAEGDGDGEVGFGRPHLGTARQAAAVLEADAALAFAETTLREGAEPDLIAGDLAGAIRALGELSGREADERLLDAIFARFCIGK
jgi:tRNA modification GTPase